MRAGAGTDGSDRITIIWADNAIEKTWLQIIVKSTTNTGIATDETYYVGNALANLSPIETSAYAVDSTDTTMIGANLIGSCDVSNLYDINRDGVVDASDQAFPAGNSTHPIFSAVKVITVP